MRSTQNILRPYWIAELLLKGRDSYSRTGELVVSHEQPGPAKQIRFLQLSWGGREGGRGGGGGGQGGGARGVPLNFGKSHGVQKFDGVAGVFLRGPKRP